MKDTMVKSYECPICHEEITAEKLVILPEDEHELHEELLGNIGNHMFSCHEAKRTPDAEQLKARIAELEKCAIVWHRFPEEKPDNRGDYYLVAMEKYVHYRDAESDSEFDKVSEVPFVRVGWWYSPGGRFEMAGTQLNGVYAWAEMPNPPVESILRAQEGEK